MSGDGPVNPRRGCGGEHDGRDDLADIARMREYLDSSGEDYGQSAASLPDHDASTNASTNARAKGPKKGPNNIEHDRFDARLYSELHEACEEIRKLEQTEGSFETFPELLSDFFYSFYKAAPRLAGEETVAEPMSRANRPFVERLLEDDETRRTRVSTRLDDMSAALAALAAGEKVLEEIQDRPELADFMGQASSEPERDGAGEDPADAPGDQPEDEAADEAADVAADEGTQDPGDGDSGQTGEDKPSPPPEQPTPPARDLRRAVRAAAEAGAEEAEQTQEALEGWGLSQADLKSVPLGERIELARSLRNPHFKHLFDLVGRMRNLARAKARENVKSRTDEIHSVELSGELSRMLPTELAAGLASKSSPRKLDFYRRFIEGEVLSYELTANERQAKGPIVAGIDCSDSMGFSGGANMRWATAVALALVDLAAGGATGAGGADKRAAALVFFNESVKKVVRFAPGERGPRKLLEVATTGASGGTRYEPAWKQMFTLCEESAHKEADLLFITDGICRVPEEFAQWIRDEKLRLGASAYSVLLGSSECQELERYSDEVWTLQNLVSSADASGPDTAAEIFERLG